MPGHRKPWGLPNDDAAIDSLPFAAPAPVFFSRQTNTDHFDDCSRCFGAGNQSDSGGKAMTIVVTAAIALLSYLIGSISFAIIVSRLLAGDDVRRHGSGNAGMTNMLRTYGKGPATLTFLGDFFKAAVAITLSRWLLARTGVTLPLDVGYVSGLCVLLGHLFPLYFHFKGGKGVASSLGIIFCINPLVFAIIAVVFVPIVLITRIVSLGSVLGALFYPFITWLVVSRQGGSPWYDTISAAIIGGLLLVMHRDNIKRLLTGTERRFGAKK